MIKFKFEPNDQSKAPIYIYTTFVIPYAEDQTSLAGMKFT